MAQMSSNKQPSKPTPQGLNKKRANKNQRRVRSRIPAAFGSSYSAFANISGSGPVTRLICQEIFPINGQTNGPFLLPVCPTKWAGTRTSMLASTYTAHRPLSIRLTWLPAVGTTQAGNVAIGTVFDGARISLTGNFAEDSISLASTNGGLVSTIWKESKTDINLKRNLRANTFPLYEVSDDDIPLWIVVSESTKGSGLVGHLMVHAKFTLRNPALNKSPAHTWSGEATFTTEDSKNIMTLNGAFTPAPAVGTAYNFAFSKDLVNASNAVIAQALSSVNGTCTSVSPLKFQVSQPFAAQTSFGSLIGLSNF